MAKNIDIPDGWEVKKLGEVAENGLVNGIFNNPKKVGSGKKLINVIDLYSERAIDTNKLSLLNVTEKEYNTYKVKQFDLFFTRSSLKLEGIAWSNILLSSNTDIIFDCHIMKLTCNTKLINPLYLFYYTRNELAREYLMSVAKLSSMTTISQQDVLNMPIPVPPLDEQKKIADILSLWDKAIQQTKELIAYKETQKKGLMQNLLTGKKRLHGFNDEWKTTKLGEIIDKEIIYKKGQPLTAERTSKGTIPVIAAGRDIPYFHHNYNFKNVITISASGAYAGYIWYHNYPIWASDCNILYGKKDIFDTIFLFYVLKSQQNKLYSLQTGGAQPHIYKNDIGQLIIPIISFNEQKAIADILSKADEEINLLNKQLDLYMEQKKGLMQNLLTGKVRV